jgi:membrane protease YdiL (CAAX protease family)
VSWWQIVLIALASIALGLLVGVLLSYAISRFVKTTKTTSSSDSILRAAKKPEVTSAVEELPKLTAADLLAEVKHNREIAVEPLTDKSQPFQTSLWDAHQHEVSNLPANLLDELSQVYTDIRLANSLVWLSTELRRQTPNLDENYRKLCNSIIERLDRIKPLIEHSTYTKRFTKLDLAPIRTIAVKPQIGLKAVEPTVYLLAIAAAQAVGGFTAPPWGILCHITVLTFIIIRAALADERVHQQPLLPLVLVPLLGIINLGLPLSDIPPILKYNLSYAPLLLGAVAIVGILGYTPEQVGVSFRRFPIQLAVGLTGVAFGLTEYFILAPEPIIAELTWQEIWLPALILLLSAGFMQEFVFRGVLQSSSVQVFGGWGIVYVSLLFAITYIGLLPPIDLLFVFVIALFFGWVVRKTGSLLGVALAHGLCSIALYLIIPFFF